MWFKRKPRNRRLGREQVLDVKLRSSQVRAARTRKTAISLGTLFAVVFGFYLLYRTGDWALNRLVYENKAFAIKQIDVQTDGVIAAEELRRWAGVRLEENLLALDLARVKRDLELFPLVGSVSVERILPHTLRIWITEREPIAQVNVALTNVSPTHPTGSVAVYHLDADGWVMLPLDLRQRAAPASPPADALPMITGINDKELWPGRRIGAPQARDALRLITAFDQSPMAGLVDLKRVDVSAPEILVVTTGQGSEVTFGLTNLVQQLRRWHTIFELGQQASNSIATLNLAITNNIPLRWLEASAVPPAAPKPAKPLRPKKKHV
jgi:cell division septal protein FtsQ